MQNQFTFVFNCQRTLPPPWKSNQNRDSDKKPDKKPDKRSSKTLIAKPSCNTTSRTRSSSSVSHLQQQNHHYKPSHVISGENTSAQHMSLLVESFHHSRSLKALLEKLSKGSSPLQILRDDKDWTKEEFWSVIRFLTHSSRSNEILEVFDAWKNLLKSRINEFNYSKMIELLSKEGLMEEALSVFEEMSDHALPLSLQIYNSIIHGFARKGKFDDALFFLSHMEKNKLTPDNETYYGIIEAYGKHGMYDEIGNCERKMRSSGCLPDRITYNLMIREFSRAGLLKRMEKLYQSLVSKRMYLQPCTLVAVLEAYANFRLLANMEKIYRRIINSKIILKDDLVRKLATVYIENHMFSRLDDLGIDLSSKTGPTVFTWSLRLLSRACLLSQSGIEFIANEMGKSGTSWDVTVANTILLAYLKMKDFKHLRVILSELHNCHLRPDLVTFGIVLDANGIDFDGFEILNAWRRMGFLAEAVNMDTDPLVLIAFGKGHFLSSCERMYASLKYEERTNKLWTYQDLIDLVLTRNAVGGYE